MRDVTQQALRSLAWSSLFYVGMVALVWTGGKVAPSGPCTPGGDVLALALAGVASLLLCLKNAVQVLRGNKTHRYSLALHGLISLNYVILYWRVTA